MNQDILNEQKRVNTDAVSLDGFIVKETIATDHLTSGNRSASTVNNFGQAELRRIQKRKRGVSARLYNRYF